MKTTFATHGIPHDMYNSVEVNCGPLSVTILLPTTDHNSPPPSLVHTFPVLVLHTVRTNSEVERFNRTVEKAIRAANVQGKKNLTFFS